MPYLDLFLAHRYSDNWCSHFFLIFLFTSCVNFSMTGYILVPFLFFSVSFKLRSKGAIWKLCIGSAVLFCTCACLLRAADGSVATADSRFWSPLLLASGGQTKPGQAGESERAGGAGAGFLPRGGTARLPRHVPARPHAMGAGAGAAPAARGGRRLGPAVQHRL